MTETPKTMSPRERVHAALRREPTDRVPIFLWFHPGTVRLLARALEIPPSLVGEAMGNDVRQAWVNNNHAMEAVVHERDGESHTDAWGIRWVKNGPFNQVDFSPLAGATDGEAEAYRFPEARLEELLAAMEPAAADRRYFLGCDVSPCCLEMWFRLRGMEEALLDLALKPRLAAAMIGRCAAFAGRLSAEALDRYPLDWLWTGDDVASQRSMLLSPESWRETIKPLLADLFAMARARGKWVAYHSCGAIRPIIPDLIEIGLDVLNPIQSGCPGMDYHDLKREFGGNLAFMGGLDTQGVLPHGSADDVRRAARDLLDTMAGGGYILAASHTIPPETPLENIFALYGEAGIGKEEILDAASDLRRRAAGR